MSTSKLVSIIVPVYNIEKYLPACLNSLITQTYPNIEIVLINDGSKDSSGAICDEYVKKDIRIKVLHKNNEGVANARLSGFQISTGEYLTFVDGDDYVSSNYIEKMMEPVNEYQVDLVSCNHNTQYGDIISPSHYYAEGLFDKSKLVSFIASDYLYCDRLAHSGIPVFLCTKLIKRDLVAQGLEAGKGLWWGEDQIAFFQIIMNANSLFVLNECLYYYVRHEGQATSIYNSSLWINQLNTYLRYKEVDKDNLLKLQLIKHVWKYSFVVNLYQKMPTKIHSCSEFSEELKKIEKHDGWLDFFKGKTTGMGKKENFKYWLLKHKLYRTLYRIFFKKIYESPAI